MIRKYNTREFVTPHIYLAHVAMTQEQVHTSDAGFLGDVIADAVFENFPSLRDRLGHPTIRVQRFEKGELPGAGARGWHADHWERETKTYLLYTSHGPATAFLVDGDLEADSESLDRDLAGLSVWSPSAGTVVAIDNRELHTMTPATETGWRFFWRVPVKGGGSL